MTAKKVKKIEIKTPGKTGKTSAIKRGINTQQPKPAGSCLGPGCESVGAIQQRTLQLCAACYSHELRWANRTQADKEARTVHVKRLNARFTKMCPGGAS